MPDDSKTTAEFIERLRGMSDHELDERMNYVSESLFNLRFRMSSGQVEDPKRIRKYRKAIARIKTLKHERKLGIR
ncbi:MAG TPA: 50S ribosomal protein L29 [Armatimonadota bacterium]|nr:50S ribosomal protein L29 [Armatimonadota bacterium]